MGIHIWVFGNSFNVFKLYYINHWNLSKLGNTQRNSVKPHWINAYALSNFNGLYYTKILFGVSQ